MKHSTYLDKTAISIGIMSNKDLKEKVQSYWNSQTCGTQFTDKEKYTKEFFEEIEKDRYEKEPEILPFAQFHSGQGKNVLEGSVSEVRERYKQNYFS